MVSEKNVKLVSFVLVVLVALTISSCSEKRVIDDHINTVNSKKYELQAPELNSDLIYAEGIDGTLGYVRSEDLNPDYQSPKEAVEQELRKKPSNYKKIPLYDSDGVTVIGEFLIE
ncbi:hypothetical protein J4772_26415 [Cohnella sp. LGH]|uniref:hypothetical protein n=1 Tax=Cohnella sp. LGH TaxID=1619153 RepID=UPI001ADC8105|nr:hypothetical protein [Cohnella sp. LGH]QTH41062.1 hypothetical protein J4772_26415 [Cohnella sp. LGH]